MVKKYNYEELEKQGLTDVHVDGELIGNFASDKEIDAKYNFRIKNPIGKFFANLFWAIVALFVPFIVLISHGTRIKGKRNLRNLKKSGAVVVPNHVLYLDCLIAAQCVYPKKLYFHVLERSMKVKGLSAIMKSLGAMPIPSKPSAKRAFMAETNQILAEGNFVCVYPEAACWPYYEKIRPFKTGAFHFAVKNNVPIVPICINFRGRRETFKKLKVRAKFVTVHIGKPIYANPQLGFNDAVTDLLNRAHNNLTRMNHWFKVIDRNVIKEKENRVNRPIFVRNKEQKQLKQQKKVVKAEKKLKKHNASLNASQTNLNNAENTTLNNNENNITNDDTTLNSAKNTK